LTKSGSDARIHACYVWEIKAGFHMPEQIGSYVQLHCYKSRAMNKLNEPGLSRTPNGATMFEMQGTKNHVSKRSLSDVANHLYTQ
jgi:hypothetical protein